MKSTFKKNKKTKQNKKTKKTPWSMGFKGNGDRRVVEDGVGLEETGCWENVLGSYISCFLFSLIHVCNQLPVMLPMTLCCMYLLIKLWLSAPGFYWHYHDWCRSMGLSNCRLNALKPGAKINLSSFKLLLPGIYHRDEKSNSCPFPNLPFHGAPQFQLHLSVNVVLEQCIGHIGLSVMRQRLVPYSTQEGDIPVICAVGIPCLSGK